MIYLVEGKEECNVIRRLGLSHISIVNGYEVYTMDNKSVSVSFILVDKKVI